MLTNKVARVLGVAGLVGAFFSLQACEQASDSNVKVSTQQGLSPRCINRDGTPCLRTPPKGAHVPPANYTVRWTKCSNWIEGDVKVRNGSRVVKVNSNGVIPIARVEPNANGEDNHRRIKLASLSKPLKGGKGLEVATKTMVEFVKIGQVILVKEQSGAISQWTVSSWNLGELQRQKDGRLAYNDNCFRNPAVVGKDTAGRVAEGTELATMCIVEDLNTDYNALSAVYGWLPIVNYAGKVTMGNAPGTHPDFADYEGVDPTGGYIYSGPGAALNDSNGTERDSLGQYFPGEEYCHFLVTNGYEVPGAKRPATKSYPAPGVVAVGTPAMWRPVNNNLDIANAEDPVAPDPIEESPEPVSDADAVPESDTAPL